MKKPESTAGSELPVKETDDSRRDFLRKAGKLAVYTPPAMILLMQPGREAFALSGGNGFNSHPVPVCDDGNAAICPD